ncbi:MAG: hypothetical protein HOM55_06930 [Proteobacteria bacterium]|jgi:hypothetical protein|nr:hypothetical protein [Pseudomonadota bacterium]
MDQENDIRSPIAPTLVELGRAVGFSIFVTVLILVTLVLPAEYGIDPLGAGRALGITVLAPSTEALVPVPPPNSAVLAPVQEGLVAYYPGEYQVDSREFVLGPYEYVEYKYHLAQNATMLFSWVASGDVAHDFHGDRDGAPASAAQSFDQQPRRKADGSFTAPFSGIHGWYWENPGGNTVTVRVTTSGFYTAAHEFHFDGTRVPREVRALDAITARRD